MASSWSEDMLAGTPVLTETLKLRRIVLVERSLNINGNYY